MTKSEQKTKKHKLLVLIGYSGRIADQSAMLMVAVEGRGRPLLWNGPQRSHPKPDGPGSGWTKDHEAEVPPASALPAARRGRSHHTEV
jgi:hypothetical protein